MAEADLHIDCHAGNGGWLCHVTVSDGTSFTEHDVTVSQMELTRYGADSTSLVALISESFAFLLAREPKDSILRSFALSDIERYFPEFGPGR